MDYRVSLLFLLEGIFAMIILWRSGLFQNRNAFWVSVALLFIALAFRYAVLPYETLDYQNFLSRWVEYFRNHGGFSALSQSIGNYNIPYLYFLSAFSYLEIYDLYLIKLTSILCDIILSWSSAMIVLKATESRAKALGVFFVVMFLPTVYLNGSVWGQCDSVFTAFAVLAIYLALDDRPVLSMICIAVSFGFKLQAVFIMPLFAVLWFAGKFKWYHFGVFPLTYVVLVLPAVLAGRPFFDTVTLYFNQTSSIGSGLNYNSSSIFAALTNVSDPVYASRMAILAAFTYMLVVLFIAFLMRKHLGTRCIIAFAVLLSVGIPFLLPHMHDRYFFVADIVSVILAFLCFEGIPAAILTQFASLLGYHAYLKMRYLLPMRYGAAALTVVIGLSFVSIATGYVTDRKQLVSR